MRGKSAESLEATLRSVASAIDDDADGHALGDELFEIVRVLDDQPALRRIFTDPAIDTSAQVRLAHELVGDKVGTATLNTLAAAVDGRWSSARDLPDALEVAGVNAHVAGAEQKENLAGLETALFSFGRIVAGNPELRSALTDRSTPPAPKKALVESLLKDRAREAVVALCRQAAAARKYSFERTLSDFSDIAAAYRTRLVATAHAAYHLDTEELDRLAKALTKKYGQDVHVNQVVDKSLIGGVVVEIQGEVIDGSMSGRIEDLRRRIAS